MSANILQLGSNTIYDIGTAILYTRDNSAHIHIECMTTGNKSRVGGIVAKRLWVALEQRATIILTNEEAFGGE